LLPPPTQHHSFFRNFHPLFILDYNCPIKNYNIPYCKSPSSGIVGCKKASLSHGKGGATFLRLSEEGFF